MTKKKMFFVQENESIDECLIRMQREGFIPIRRIEQPIFKEILNQDGQKEYVAIDRIIKFEGKSIK
jgi:NETI protein